MNKRKLYWTLQIGGWSSFVLVELIIRILSTESQDFQLLFFTIEGSLFFTITHYFRFWIKRHKWVNLSMVKVIPRSIFSVIILAIIIYFLRIAFVIPLGLYDSGVAWDPITIVGMTLTYALILFIWLVIYFAYHYFMNYNLALKQDAAIKEIELQNLKSQLNPHFIFNALNSIRALVDENPVKSKSAITQLSNILRNSLVSDKKRLTLFSEELQMVDDYLSLERVRYEERLSIEMEIHPETYNFLIPPLMLQTIVENGIKHGVSKLKSGGKIQIKGYIKKAKLVIEVRNSGHFEKKEKSKTTGLGIINTEKRLNMIYGDTANFFVKNEEHGTVLAYLEIPKSEEL